MKLFAIGLLIFSVFAFVAPQTTSAALVDCGGTDYASADPDKVKFEKTGDNYTRFVNVDGAWEPKESDWRKSGTTFERGQAACGACDLFQLFNRIVVFLLFPAGDVNNGLAVVPLLATFFIIFGGMKILLARGNESSYTSGKNIIWAVAIGLIVVYSAYAAVNTIMSALGVAAWTGLGSWWEIQCRL